MSATEDLERILKIAGQQGKFIEGNRFFKPQKADDFNEQTFYEIVHGVSSHPLAKTTILNALQCLSSFVPHYSETLIRSAPHSESDTNDRYLVLENLFAPYRKPAVLDIKVSLPSTPQVLDRTGVANLLGCYIHGVESHTVSFHNRFNEYAGRNKPIDHFYTTLDRFFSHCPDAEPHRVELLKRLRTLSNAIQHLSKLGFQFVSSSLLFVFEQDHSSHHDSHPLSLHFLDFERVLFNQLPLTAYLPPPSSASPAPPSLPPPVPLQDLLSSPTFFASQPICNSVRLVCHAVRQALLPHHYAVSVYLVRHGERHDYTDHSWAPHSPHPHDAHLSAAGERQSQDFADRLRHLKVHRLASAPMQRAILGAEPIARATRSKICVEPGFTEFLCSKTRTRVPSFFSRDVSISPWIDEHYQPHWPHVQLESWPDVFARSGKAVRGLVAECREAKGDLVIVSHRSTLQTVFKALLPDFEDDTMLEYGGLSMITEVEPGSGRFEMVTFNELSHLRDRIQSPSSNPFRHIEGYYEDLSWSSYKSTADMWANTEPKPDTTLETTPVS